jgi:hypothetical protein
MQNFFAGFIQAINVQCPAAITALPRINPLAGRWRAGSAKADDFDRPASPAARQNTLIRFDGGHRARARATREIKGKLKIAP